jgi:glutamate formiminotransferase / 5-formyltetrahydrofolate cyclo-ligase
VFECVINISEGSNVGVLNELASSAGTSLRDLHSDSIHNRSVFTLINEKNELLQDVKNFVTACYQHLSLAEHEGVHPRFGVVDVVPFVALNKSEGAQATAMRNETAKWLSETFAVPVFLYGASRPLPEIRKTAFKELAPDFGPPAPHHELGAVAMGERPVLLAWNIWLSNCTLARARSLATSVRSKDVRTLAFVVGDFVQVSCNLIAPDVVKPSEVFDQVAKQLEGLETIHHCELVGLCPSSVVSSEDPSRLEQLGLSYETTIEARCS